MLAHNTSLDNLISNCVLKYVPSCVSIGHTLFENTTSACDNTTIVTRPFSA